MQRKLVNPSSFSLLSMEAENAFALQTLFGQRMRGRREINCFFSCFHRFCNPAFPIDFELNRNFPVAKFHPISKKIQSKGSMDIGKVLTLVRILRSENVSLSLSFLSLESREKPDLKITLSKCETSVFVIFETFFRRIPRISGFLE